MSPAEIIEQATAEGVILALSPRGTIKATGEQLAIDKWLPAIRDNKAAIITVLKVGADSTANTPMTPADNRIEKVIGMQQADPGLQYVMETHFDIEPDGVILTLTIRGKGACELRIPKSRYDAFALLELIEKHTTRETLQ